MLLERRTRGFTLIELLVVIAIIAMRTEGMPSFVNYSSGQASGGPPNFTLSLPVPTGTAQGDILILDASEVLPGYIWDPSGWTLIAASSTNSFKGYWKLYQGEAGPYVVTFSTLIGSTGMGAIRSYRGIAQTNPIDQQNLNRLNYVTQITNQLFNLAPGDLLVSSLRGAVDTPASYSITLPTGDISRYQFEESGNHGVLAGSDVVQASSGNTPIKTATYSAQVIEAVYLLVALKPAP